MLTYAAPLHGGKVVATLHDNDCLLRCWHGVTGNGAQDFFPALCSRFSLAFRSLLATVCIACTTLSVRRRLATGPKPSVPTMLGAARLDLEAGPSRP